MVSVRGLTPIPSPPWSMAVLALSVRAADHRHGAIAAQDVDGAGLRIQGEAEQGARPDGNGAGDLPGRPLTTDIVSSLPRK